MCAHLEPTEERFQKDALIFEVEITLGKMKFLKSTPDYNEAQKFVYHYIKLQRKLKRKTFFCYILVTCGGCGRVLKFESF